MNQVTVKAKEGARCPREENPRKYISDSQEVTVPLTPYYRRLIRDGSLIDIKAAAEKEKAARKSEKETALKAENKGGKK